MEKGFVLVNDANRLRNMRLVLAAMKRELDARGWTDDGTVFLDTATFARAVRKLGGKTRLRASFPVLASSTGPQCPEFRHGMSVAKSAGIISCLTPSSQRFTVNISARQIADIAKDMKGFAEARVLASEYLALMRGLRSEIDPDAGPQAA